MWPDEVKEESKLKSRGQVGWGLRQPGLVESVPVHGRAVGTKWSLRYSIIMLELQALKGFGKQNCFQYLPSAIILLERSRWQGKQNIDSRNGMYRKKKMKKGRRKKNRYVTYIISQSFAHQIPPCILCWVHPMWIKIILSTYGTALKFP